MAELEVKTGPAAGQVLELTDESVLGRDVGVDMRLDDQALSRRHASFSKDRFGRYVVEDLGSHNGTFVNRRRVTRHVLRDGDVIQAGKTQFVFRRSETASAIMRAEQTQLDVFGEDSTTVLNTIAVDAEGETEAQTGKVSAEQLQVTYRRLRTLMRMFQSIDIGMDEGELLAGILDTLFRAFPDTDRGFIVLRDPDTGRLTPAAVKASNEESKQRLSMSRTLLQYVLEKKQTVLSTDAMHDGRFQASETVHDLNLRSVMCAPLKHEDEILGFISLDTHRVTPSYNKEALGMLAAIANFASLTIANARLHHDLMAQERIEQDLRNAHRIQHSFLPQGPPDIPGYEFAYWYNAAQEVGGDFYDFIELPDDRVAISIGDVSGKGITAALLMAKLTTTIRSVAASGVAPGELVARLNESFPASETGRYVTLMFMVLDEQQHALDIINAGHWPPLRRSGDGAVQRVECHSSLPVGIEPDVKYSPTRIELAPEDRLCVFTDGVIDAMNLRRQPYGEDRLQRTLAGAGPSAETILESVQQSVWHYMGEAEQHDDTTLVCFGRMGT
jgi:serine phosphatase RsbU (regulator of sigma subunit)/pSer/pThr/pTyr-binding forkhead associated (FHA) protein